MILWLGACAETSPPGDGSTTTAFTNAYTSSDALVLERFPTELTCPDGEPASFFAVYPTDAAGPLPVVVVFHSGAFDYAGYHSTSRLTASWAEQKVYETLGIRARAPLDTTEVNEGTLPAALAEAGTFALYPANCWGDLWHNEDYYAPNDWDADGGLHRQGRYLAWWMTRAMDVDVDLDTSAIYLVGLGEGGRAIAELVRRERDAGESMPPLGGLILDSTMDDLSPLYADDRYTDYVEGLRRIFPNDEATGLGGWIGEHGLETSLQVVWSSQDPEVPAETLATLVGLDDPNLEVTDRAEPRHVFLNADYAAAEAAVSRMLR